MSDLADREAAPVKSDLEREVERRMATEDGWEPREPVAPRPLTAAEQAELDRWLWRA